MMTTKRNNHSKVNGCGFFSIMISLGGLKAVGDGIYESVRMDSCDKIFELYMTHKRNSGDFL
jgi:hypothetical protein